MSHKAKRKLEVSENWVALGASTADLNLNFTLPTGQSFRWIRFAWDSEHDKTNKSTPTKQQKSTKAKAKDKDKEGAEELSTWVGVVGDKVVQLKEDDGQIYFRCVLPQTEVNVDRLKSTLQDYFSLSVLDLPTKYVEFGASDKRFAEVSPYFPGVRLLRQAPLECLFCFICSSNNNIKRIHSMVNSLCTTWGTCLGEFRGTKFFSFPSLEQLAKASSSELKALGFGYRAEFIVKSVGIVEQNGGEDWLLKLRTAPRDEVMSELTSLPGVGRKVASCVALFCLDKHNEIPVDTHVFQIATRDYGYKPKTKSLTDKVYNDIGELFRTRFGGFAGWAHNTLFVSDIAEFHRQLPSHLQKRRQPKKTKST